MRAAVPALLTSRVMLLSSRSTASTFASAALSPRSAGITLTDATRLRRQSRGQGFQLLAVARHEDEVIAALREPVGVNSADAGRSAGNKGRAEGMGHSWNS